jgi:hypothetical protein
MSFETDSPQRQSYNFNEIEAAVRETERGRWFLAEYDRRSRSGDTQALLEAIRKLERVVRAVPQERAASAYRPDLAEAIRNAKIEIEAVQDSPFQSESSASPRCDTFSYLTVQAKSVAVELSQFCEVLQSTSESLKQSPEGTSGALAHLTERLLHIVASQEGLANRVAKAANFLVYLDRVTNGESDPAANIAAQLEKFAADTQLPAMSLTDDNLKYFHKDEELFTGDTPKHLDPLFPSSQSESSASALPTSEPKLDAGEPNPTVADTSAKTRIVIVRTPSTTAQPIPLADILEPTPRPAA